MTHEENDSLSVTLSRVPYRRSHFFYSVHPPIATGDIQYKGRETWEIVHFKVTKIGGKNF